MKLLPALIRDAIVQRQLTVRKACLEIGVSHNTIPRILEGDTPTLDVFLKICQWLKVNPSTVLDGETYLPDALPSQIAAILEAEPRLASTFSKAIERVLDGRMSAQTFRELAAFAAYRLELPTAEEEPYEQSAKQTGGERGSRKE